MYNSEASTMQIVLRGLPSKRCWQMLQYDLVPGLPCQRSNHAGNRSMLSQALTQVTPTLQSERLNLLQRQDKA